uniref:Putative trypsin-like peptidase domain containing protein n=1 Tax=viral metagenome TaxID=1070528 RepID=A0A6M3JIM8_9ZZZZ
MTIQELHQRILYPVVRVRTKKAGGSGTVIYSKPNQHGKYESFIMTCAHVIDDAIEVKKEWDSFLKKKIEKEFTEQVQVEVFDYVDLSKVNSSNALRADIIAYDKIVDIAILKLDSPKPCPYIAKLIEKDNVDSVKLFTDAYASGCSLGHDPICNQGQVTYVNEKIENKQYFMSNCSSIFGNSGGALFLADTGEQIGITARISAIQLGFGVDIITWMGFSIAPSEIYKFIDEQELKFLYDSSDTFEAAMKRREKKQRESLMARKIDEESDEPKEEE